VYAKGLNVASRRQRRRRDQLRRAPVLQASDEPLAPVFYSREQAAQLLGISLATLDRRVLPTIATVKTEWGARLIPVAEFDRFLAERREEPRARRRRASAPDASLRYRRMSSPASRTTMPPGRALARSREI